jgi:hypothetical protein
VRQDGHSEVACVRRRLAVGASFPRLQAEGQAVQASEGESSEEVATLGLG